MFHVWTTLIFFCHCASVDGAPPSAAFGSAGPTIRATSASGSSVFQIVANLSRRPAIR
ncbi:hypothetical protein [Nannocystis pusilla]|uniref:hypothetical protein n=1 Tax=Nannocystis pusilla TaxID=889268 RepID=UPI003B7EE436